MFPLFDGLFDWVLICLIVVELEHEFVIIILEL
jgi:hypothetical protein